MSGTPKRLVSILAASLSAALFVTACQGGAADTTTSTTDSLVELPPPPTTAVRDTTTTLGPIDELTAPEYQIVKRIPGEDGGDELVVQLDPTSYDTLTDIDLQDLIAEVVAFFPPVWTLHIVDDSSAAVVVADPEATAEDIAAIQAHYLARLDNGIEITYLGPFADSGTGVLGS